jgi:F-type H+-transporting ATPase subunit delta
MAQDAATADAPAGRSGAISAIASRYADALFDLAREAHALDAVEREMAAIRKAIGQSADLRSFLRSPIYDSDDQARAIAKISEKAGFSPLSRDFIGLVARNRRLFALDAMASAFLAKMAAHRGEVTAEAISAAPLSEDQTKRLRGEIERVVGKAVNLNARVDPELLGGLVVKVGSKMIDSSLKTKLSRLKSVLKEA